MKIAPHVSIEEVKDKLHTADRERQRGKWLVIYNALVDPRPADTNLILILQESETV
jgi:hypothetical protein